MEISSSQVKDKLLWMKQYCMEKPLNGRGEVSNGYIIVRKPHFSLSCSNSSFSRGSGTRPHIWPLVGLLQSPTFHPPIPWMVTGTEAVSITGYDPWCNNEGLVNESWWVNKSLHYQIRPSCVLPVCRPKQGTFLSLENEEQRFRGVPILWISLFTVSKLQRKWKLSRPGSNMSNPHTRNHTSTFFSPRLPRNDQQ